MTVTRRLLIWGCALVIAVSGCAAGYDQTAVQADYRSPGGEVSVSYFYDNLSPYGHWVQLPAYGWCWTPYDVSLEWRPYTDGRWTYTDYGWCWVANEPWGWAPYHYGRWFFDDDYGWMWVPGTVWAPAWVAWRYSDDWVGWAPLPPMAAWDVSVGLTFSNASAIPPTEWCFVPQRHLLDAGIRMQVISVAHNGTLLQRSRDATRFEARGGHPVNLGLDVATVQRAVGRPVPRARVFDVDSPGRSRGQPAGAGAVGVFRPSIQPARHEPEPPVIAKKSAVPPEVLQRKRDEEQRKLESDLDAERARLARDQENELRAGRSGPGGDEIRRRHAAEQQAFEAHAAQQRRVLENRMNEQIVRPDVAKDAGKSGKASKGKGKGQGKSGG